jgi:hypothetical protein
MCVPAPQLDGGLDGAGGGLDVNDPEGGTPPPDVGPGVDVVREGSVDGDPVPPWCCGADDVPDGWTPPPVRDASYGYDAPTRENAPDDANLGSDGCHCAISRARVTPARSGAVLALAAVLALRARRRRRRRR